MSSTFELTKIHTDLVFQLKKDFEYNILAASIPAFLAPAAPIAVVATGIPPGI